MSTDSDFTITFDGVLGSPGQDAEEEGVWQDRERSNDEEESPGRKATRLSPRQRLRRQSLARFKKKIWGEEWIV